MLKSVLSHILAVTPCVTSPCTACSIYPEEFGEKLQDPTEQSELREILFVATGLLNPTSFCNRLGLDP